MEDAVFEMYGRRVGMTRQERRLVEALVGGRVAWGREDRRPVVRVRVVKGVGRGKREGERGKVAVFVGR